MRATRRLLDSARDLRDWMQLPRHVRDAHRRDRSGPGIDPGLDRTLEAATEWLCRAQDNSSTADGGVARHYSLLEGWGASYPETTGYIVPTLLAQAERLQDGRYADSAVRMLDWLVRIQLPCGGYQGGTVKDVPVVPVTFNTGQILMGLAAGTERSGEPYRTATMRAAAWLADSQAPDGAWRTNESPFALAGDKTYHTHTAWGLLEAARACQSARFADAALRNIRWALGKLHENGWFADCCLTDPLRPLTHTLGYALRGIIEGYRFSNDERLLAAAVRAADGLMSTQRDDGSVPGRIDSSMRGAVSWVCLTGNVQIAHCWLQLRELTGQHRYLDAGRAANEYVRRTVDVDGPPETAGAVRGSFPVSGEYGRYQYLNWAAKFFIDSNALEKDLCGATE